MVMKKLKNGEEVQQIPVPIKWHISDNIISRFATNMTVQIIQTEFKVSFFEIQPELRLEAKPILPKEVRAECVASIIVTPDRLAQFIEVLQRQLNVYNERNKPKE